MPLRSSDFALPEDLAACRRLLCNGSRTFYAASLVLPRTLRDPATALYAFCRVADDAIDRRPDHARALIELRKRLNGVYRGRPIDHPADRAFTGLVHAYGIPQALPEALLEGFEWDAEGRRYISFPDLRAYAVRVAGTVGAMMGILMGVRDAHVLARACDLGVAMQLTNIARDVGEDARDGRVYLPLDWLADAGVDVKQLTERPQFTHALGKVVQHLLREADNIYARAAAGIGSLPLTCRPGMHAARMLYAEIGREVERGGLDSVSRRAVVSGQRKLGLVARALAPKVDRDALMAPALPEARFVVESVTSAFPAPAAPERTMPPAWNLHARLVWVIELFEDLERRERVRGA